MTLCEARQVCDQMQCGRCGLAWDVADPEPPACARTIDKRAIPTRRCTVADRRVEASLVERPAPYADAWVDDTGRVKFRLGLVPVPGMKLYLAPPA